MPDALLERRHRKNLSVDESISIVRVDCPESWDHVIDIRRRVFEVEQGMTGVTLFDQDDDRGLTLIAYLEDLPVGTGRLTPPYGHHDAFIAWVATSRRFRGLGIGSRITEQLVAVADASDYAPVRLSAQLHAVALYERFGFVETGNEFTVRGIRHKTMIRTRTL